MFIRFLKLFFLASISVEYTLAKSIVECKNMTKEMTECNPYGKEFRYVGGTVDDSPYLHKKKSFLKIITVSDMMKKYTRSQEASIDNVKHHYAVYRVVEGDSLFKIAKKLGVKLAILKQINTLKDISKLHIGQKLNVPLEQYMVDVLSRVPYNASKKTFGTRKLRVTATAYTSHKNQTDTTPFLAAWSNRLKPGMKSIAVSRDLLTQYGLKNGTKVHISGLKGHYRVRDKMNKRYRKRIDIYMGLNLRKAQKWGRRSVVIYW